MIEALDTLSSMIRAWRFFVPVLAALVGGWWLASAVSSEALRVGVMGVTFLAGIAIGVWWQWGRRRPS